MKGTKLELSSTWTVGDQLDQGSFGRVYELTGGNQPAVAKFVPKTLGADRELLFVDLEGSRNVVPIIDSGEYQHSWVLVMPRADKSLRKHIEESGDVLGLEDALTVLLDVAIALVGLDGLVVHRDLKPENVLLLNGFWCLADSGSPATPRHRRRRTRTSGRSHRPTRHPNAGGLSAPPALRMSMGSVSWASRCLRGIGRFLAPRWRITATSTSMPTSLRSTACPSRWRPCWTSACSRHQRRGPHRRTC